MTTLAEAQRCREARGGVDVIVLNEHSLEGDAELFFGPLVDPVHTTEDTGMRRLLVEHGFFPNNAQAKGAGFPHQIPEGFNEWEIGKKAKRRRLCILRPKEDKCSSATSK